MEVRSNLRCGMIVGLTGFFLSLGPTLGVTVLNSGFEDLSPGADSASYPYPEPNDWSYLGSSTPAGLLGSINESLGTIPATLDGNNWLLVDSRMDNHRIFQPLGTINLGDIMNLEALVGHPTNVDSVSNFEIALYRSIGGSGTPDELLTAINSSSAGVAALTSGATADVAAESYLATAADAGETLFVQVGLLSGSDNPVLQALIDDVRVEVIPVPEPSVPSLLLTVSLLGWRRHR